ncbi:MAG TPA: TfoX/Sxy family protein [Stellaceae bacterium]|jgi:DNA transformation protein|nr:TfoX/Sxy family protein [Stellaceae bacterium]
MAKASDPLADFVCDQLRDWAPVAARRLFGGWGIYNGPVMFGLIARDTIYFRVDDRNRPDYVAAATKPFVHTARRRGAGGEIAAGPKPFTYQMPNGKIIEMAYYEVPPEILDDTEGLGQWAAKAQAAALGAKAAKTRPKKKSTPKKLGRK